MAQQITIVKISEHWFVRNNVKPFFWTNHDCYDSAFLPTQYPPTLPPINLLHCLMCCVREQYWHVLPCYCCVSTRIIGPVCFPSPFAHMHAPQANKTQEKKVRRKKRKQRSSETRYRLSADGLPPIFLDTVRELDPTEVADDDSSVCVVDQCCDFYIELKPVIHCQASLFHFPVGRSSSHVVLFLGFRSLVFPLGHTVFQRIIHLQSYFLCLL